VAWPPLPVAGPLIPLIVWGTGKLQLPVMGITPPSWKWGATEVLIDLWHHVVYAAATVGG
jgi:hypothetical protein